jgi:hypothetical protein
MARRRRSAACRSVAGVTRSLTVSGITPLITLDHRVGESLPPYEIHAIVTEVVP